MKTKLTAADTARTYVDRWALAATGVGWVPGSGLVLIPADLEMIREVAQCFEVEHYDLQAIAGTAAAALTGRTASEVLSVIPILGWAIKSAIAGSVTKALGEAAIAYMWHSSPLPHELRLYNKASGKAIDIVDFKSSDGAKLQLWDYVGGSNQKWTLAKVSDDLFRIVSLHCNKVIDIPDSIESGYPLQIWSYWGGENQKFRLEQRSDDTFTIFASHTSYAVSASEANHGNGVGLFTEAYSGKDFQDWRFIRA
jgi:uncharacterized protein (DUF697 family)